MSTSIELLTTAAAPPDFAPLSEAVWQAWLAKGRVREQRGNAFRIKALQLVCTAALIVSAALWMKLGQADVAVKFIVTAGALVSMVQAFRARHYTLAMLFATLMVVYNPWVPLMLFPSNWHWIAVLLSAVPFLVPLASRPPAGDRV